MSSSLWPGAPVPWRAGTGGPRGTFTKQDDNSVSGTLKTLNASASAPVGLYRVTDAPAERGALVLVRPPDDIVALAAERAYLPAGVPLIKRVDAVSGDHVCAIGSAVVLHTETVVRRLDADAAGRPLPRWSGCRRLAEDEVFLLMADAPDSFDSRYFGPVPLASVMGRLVPLWTD